MKTFLRRVLPLLLLGALGLSSCVAYRPAPRSYGYYRHPRYARPLPPPPPRADYYRY